MRQRKLQNPPGRYLATRPRWEKIMADVLLTEDNKRHIAEIAKRDLETQFKGEVSLAEINVETRMTNDGEPYTHLSIVYDSPEVELDPKILSGFNRRNLDAFLPYIATDIITQSYTHAKEHRQIRQLIAEGRLPDVNA